MKKITFLKALDLICNADSLILCGEGAVEYFVLENGEDGFLEISWENDEGLYFREQFSSEENEEVAVEGCILTLTQGPGVKSEFKLLDTINIEKSLTGE